MTEQESQAATKRLLSQGRTDCPYCKGVGLVGPDGEVCGCVRIGGGRPREIQEATDNVADLHGNF